MLNFKPFRNKEINLTELVAGLTRDDLYHLTNETIDSTLAQIADCVDTDVTYTPLDPSANDPFAEKAEDVNLAWNLGHVIVHVTASAEESAAIAAELGRGVVYHGRSRYETPWESVTSITQCRQRLEESRRLRIASLQMWPDIPHLENTYEGWPGAPVMNAIGRFVYGLIHNDSHVEQVTDIISQAKAARV